MMTFLLHLILKRGRLVGAGIFFSLGTVLLSLHIAGRFQSPDYRSEHADLTHYWNELRAGKTFLLEEATVIVREATSHQHVRYIKLQENWVQWLAAAVYEPLRRTQNTRLLIRGGVAECSERSQILKSIAEELGYSCRFVGLGGHVVLEVAIDDQWYVADPEFGLTFPLDANQLAHKSHEEMIRRALQVRRVHSDQIDSYLHILQSQNDNVRMPIGHSLSPRLKVLEEICHWLSWFIPIACYVAAFNSLLAARPLGSREAIPLSD